MPLETVTYIDDLNQANPGPNDPASQGDDHIRNIKLSLKNTFPNLTAVVTRTAAQINALVENTRSIATGDGLLGGGNLTANRTIKVNTTVARYQD